MSLFPAYLNARKRTEDLDSPSEPELVADSRPVFELVPPQPIEAADAESEPEPEVEPPKLGRNVHTVGVSDLGRMAIDNEGRLYWDGKPVEIRRRLVMSRPQVIGASFVAAFVMIGALGAIVQGSAAARDWACRLGWTSSYCTLPGSTPLRHSDIPA